jgi:hypothetical protein
MRGAPKVQCMILRVAAQAQARGRDSNWSAAGGGMI